MSILINSLSLPPSRSTTPSEVTNTWRPRSNSNRGVSHPPRYSTLEGVLPSTAIFPPVMLIDENDALATLRPPRYSSVFIPQEDEPSVIPHIRRYRQHQHRDQTFDSLAGPSSDSPHKYEYSIGNGNKDPSAMLRVFSRSSASSSSGTQKTPRFRGTEAVNGCLELKLNTPQSVHSITLSLRGRIVTSSYEGGSSTFIEQSIISWDRTKGDPRALSLPPGFPESSTPRRKFDGKLSGGYIWPFSFPFPAEVQEQGTMCPAPQSFLERGTNGSVQYELVLRMNHGMLLRSDSKLIVNLAYVPDIKPVPCSILRQLAYSERLKVPSPSIDPEGWLSLPTTTLRGKLAAKRNIEMQCILSLANPQSYNRGTIIPCHLKLSSNDTRSLDELANPSQIAVHLVRRVEFYDEAGQSLSRTHGRQGALTHCPSGSMSSLVGTNEVMVERAVWWPREHGEDEQFSAHQRELNGEIHLAKDLQPSCFFSLFKVSYTVELFPFESPILKSPETSKSILSHPVTIATLPSEGPTPVAITKPREKRSVRAREITVLRT